MRFTEHFDVHPGNEDDWFDPLLNADTRLFVDPFLIFEDPSREWQGAHEEIIQFFNIVLSLVAKSEFRPRSAHWEAAARLLIFPEPAEFCLGLAVASVRGSGSAKGLRSSMLEGAETAIRAGLVRVEHFEELTLFGPGIGVDRISDITCNVLKERFIDYTQGVVNRHTIPLSRVGVRHASWSEEFRRWSDRVIELPKNPFLNRGVLLTPSRFLREIPVIEPSDFWDWSWTNHNEQLRNEFNYEVARRVNAREIIRLARRHPDYVREYVRHKEEQGAQAYDFGNDPSLTSWYERGAELAGRHPLEEMPSGEKEFCSFIEAMLGNFVHAVEETDAWQLLWIDNDRPRSERLVQALFRSVMVHYCRANNIDLSGEANAGRGPVDFKFSAGWSARAVMEVKLTNNSRYWHGIREQTPQYMRSEDVRCGFFLSVGFRDQDFLPERMELVRETARVISEAHGASLRPIFVDARQKPPASRA